MATQVGRGWPHAPLPGKGWGTSWPYSVIMWPGKERMSNAASPPGAFWVPALWLRHSARRRPGRGTIPPKLSDLAPIERDDAALRHSAEWPRYARYVTAGNTLHRCSATAALRCDVVRCHNPHE